MKKPLMKMTFFYAIAVVLILAVPTGAEAQPGCNFPAPSNFITTTDQTTMTMTWSPVSIAQGYFLEVFDVTAGDLFFSTTIPFGTNFFVVSGIQPTHQYSNVLKILCPDGCIGSSSAASSGGRILVEDVVLLQGIPTCGLNCQNPANPVLLTDTLLLWPNSVSDNTRLLQTFSLKKNGAGTARYKIARDNDTKSLIFYQDCNGNNNNCDCFVLQNNIICTSGGDTILRSYFRDPNKIIVKTYDNWSVRYKTDSCAQVVVQEVAPGEEDRAVSQEAGDQGLMPDNWHCFPNPAEDQFFITFNLPVPQVVSIRLVNTYGQEIISFIKEEKINQGFFSDTYAINGVPEGVYFVEFRSESGTRADKIVVER